MTDFREILLRNGFGFKKRFGQNFITDENLLSAIVSDAGVTKDDAVLEIGAGAGTLTRALSKRAKRVLSFEIDRSLEPVLAETLSGCDNAEVVFRDFERADLAALEKELGDYLVVANLPYYITTPVVMKFAEQAKRCRGITVMVQEEVAERLCAEAGSSAYGAITAMLALKGECTLTRKVSRNLFTPRPNVDSAIVRVRFEENRLGETDERAYRAVVRAAFSARRKTLENNLMNAFRLSREEAGRWIAAAGFSENVRGEALSPREFARLSRLIPPSVRL